MEPEGRKTDGAMIRKLNLIVVACAALALVGLLVAMSKSVRREGWLLEGKVLTIYGPDYTLERLAAEVADPEILSYDKDKRQAIANVSLVVEGGLRIGHPDDPKLGETLMLDTIVCGDLRVEVARGGRLEIYNSTLQTVTQVITQDKCSRGYYFVADGQLVARDSHILYMSGARGETARRNAAVDLRGTSFALSDDCAFHTRGADGRRLEIRDSRFLCEGAYGFWVEGPSPSPVRLVRCQLFGSEADLYLSGYRPAAELLDCQFSKQKVRFQRPSGSATIKWSVAVRVLRDASGHPIANARVVARSTGPGPSETVEGQTDATGACTLILTEYLATPSAPAGGPTNVTPHRIAAYAPDGRLLGEVPSHEATGVGGRVTIQARTHDTPR